MSNEMNSGALDWNSTIEKESEFELLPEGTYDFTVAQMERGYFDGSDKMSACPVANLTLEVRDPVNGQSGKVFESLYLHAKSEWRLSQFFTAIGQKKKGEPLVPNWNLVPGSKGRLELSINEYTNKKTGEKRKNNRVSRFLPAEQKKFVPGQF